MKTLSSLKLSLTFSSRQRKCYFRRRPSMRWN